MRLTPDPSSLEAAAQALREGKLVAFPTETVYGLGARADRDDAVRAIYAAKGRPANNPTIVHTADAASAFALAEVVPDAARLVAAKHWPGPLTIVLRVRDGAVSRVATAGGDTVALRVPAHPVALELLARAAVPVAAPSANRSSRISPTTAAHVEKSLGTDVMVVDAGPTGFGIESTIVDCTATPAIVLRRGSIPIEDLAALIGVVDRGDRVETAQTRAPGGFSKHYAPHAPVDLLRGSQILHLEPDVGYLLFEGTVRDGDKHATVLRLAPDPVLYARDLYAALHALDDAWVSRIVVEAPPEDPGWAAVWDRLRRASA